jgi:hypothetical protein
VKFETKIEFDDDKKLLEIIKSSYLKKDGEGRLHGKKDFINIPRRNRNFKNLKGLNNMIIRIYNDSIIIDGPMRFVVFETKEWIRLYPASLYYIEEYGKYNFFN